MIFKPIKYENILFDNSYEISDHAVIRKMTPDGYFQIPIYQSSLGYNYCQLEICDDIHLVFQVDKLMGYSWLKDMPPIISEDTRLSIIHKDGNPFNDNLNNIKWIIEEEEWKTIDNLDIKQNMYEVSSFGRVRNKQTLQFLSQHDCKGYRHCNFQSSNNDNHNPGISRSIHRLVAEAFIPNLSSDTIIVNHINGIKHDNYWRNLEWVTISENIQHAVYFNLEKPLIGSDNPSSILNEDIVKHIWMLLIDDADELNGRPKTNGSPVIVKKYIDEDFPNSGLELYMITSIKGGKSWTSVTSKLPQKQFENLHSIVNPDIVRHIWLLLIDDENELNGREKTNGSPKKVFDYLIDEDMPVKRRIIESIKFRLAWTSITNDLPQVEFKPLYNRKK